MLELFQFTEVSIGEPIEEPAGGLAGYHNGLRPRDAHAVATGAVRKTRAPSSPNWKVNWVPQGFRQVRGPNGSGMVFTDGVATVSVFVEKRTGKSLGELQTQVGGTVVLSKPIKGSEDQITVVGVVPFATATRLAESVEPVIY